MPLDTVDLNTLIKSTLDESTVIITPNARLADDLLKRYACHQPPVFAKPKILPYQAWLNHIITSNSRSEKMLLPPHQSDELWLQVVEGQNFVNRLIVELKKAWGHCHQWLLPIDENNFNNSHETQQFYAWTEHYQQLLDEQQAIDESLAAEYLMTMLASLPYRHEMTIIWAYFNELTPQQQALIEWLESFGHRCHQHQQTNTSDNNSYLFAAPTIQHQESALMQWVNDNFDSNDKIAVVVPDLAKQRDRLLRLFRNHFDENDFNLTLGQPLAHYPLISQALEFLKLTSGYLSNETAQLLLTSPFIADAEAESMKRWHCLNILPCLQQSQLKLSTFLTQLKPHAPQLFKLLNKLSNIDFSGKHRLDFWAHKFKSLLITLGYPGQRGLDSANFQCFKRFEALFEEFINCHVIYPSLDLYHAHALLERLAQKTVFQAQKLKAKIQILGLLEAAGLKFDKTWVMNMTDQCLPQAANPSPFIPLHLQQQLNMPHSSHEKELHYAETLIHDFNANSSQCIFSFPQLTDDVITLPCPLIKKLPSITITLDTSTQQSEIRLLSKTESNILPIENHEKIRGGTFIIKNQALCPFKAFAKYRLHANEGIEETNDLTPLDRGLLIHRVLELFWQQVQSQQTLLALSENECNEIINNCITEALKPLQEERPELFSDQTCDFERFRLSNLTQRWLILEKQRPPFTVIAQEQWQSLILGELELNMRVDRVDQLENGEKWVIDYKTGQPSPNEWFNKRSPEPQLPLYALCDEEITALVFSQLRSRDLRNKGVSADECEVPGIKPIAKIKEAASTWQEQRDNWHQQLTNLADEFMRGDIRIAPQKPTICQRCEFKRLCRINYQ